MLIFWRELLLAEGIPFLKVELLRDNPIGGEDAMAILREVEPIDPAFCSLMKSHLARITTRPQRSALARSRYAMIRKRYDLKRKKRWIRGVLNFIKLESLTVLVHAGRMVRRLFCSRQDLA
jgi:hypothetical protein